MTDAPSDGGRRSFADYSLRWLSRLVTRHPVAVLLVSIGLSCVAVAYTQSHLAFKTSRADLIDPKADYQKRWLKYTESFGDSSDMVVVVEAENPEAIKQVLDDLGPRLERESQFFKNVLYKVDPASLSKKGLQYRSQQELTAIEDRLNEFGLVLRGRWSLLTLESFLEELRTKLIQAGKEPPEIAAAMAGPLANQTTLLASSISRFIANPQDYRSPWQQLVALDRAQWEKAAQVRYLLNQKGNMGFLKVQPAQKDTLSFSGAAPAIDRLREVLADAERRYPNAKLGLTGIPVLESDEMRASQADMFWASVLSFVGVAALLVLGFRGVRHPFLGMALLAVGMAWSFGFTTATIGHLNILSVSFATMLVGLGGDFAIVYLSSYLEMRHQKHSLHSAILETSGTVGPGIVTAAITVAVAFLAAVFVDFVGVAELGIIACGGILLCCVATFVVLPAMIAVCDRYTEPRKLPNPFQWKAITWLIARHPAPVAVISGSAVVLFALFGLRVNYDYNLLHLQADGLKSVAIQKRIFEQAEGSLLFAVSVARSQKDALDLKQKLEKLPTVHHVDEIASMLPVPPVEDTLPLVKAIQARLTKLPAQAPRPEEVDLAGIDGQIQKLDVLLNGFPVPGTAHAGDAIGHLVDQLNGLPDMERQMQVLRDYQIRMVADLLAQMKALAAAANPEPVQVADLPPALASRFVSSQGQYLLQVYPKAQIWDMEPLSHFIKDIRTVDPDATGTPLQTFEATRDIKHSYETVGIYALIAVCLILLIDFRSLSDAALAMVPPAMGALLMFGILGYFGIDLNPANLIVLPLIVGIGVNGGVHIVHDYRLQTRRYRTSSSTINALLLNDTTTMVGFGSMMIAAHRGLYSLGLVLTIGIGCCMFVSLILLPAILTLISRSRRRTKSRRHRLLPEPAPELAFPQPPHGQRSASIGHQHRPTPPGSAQSAFAE